jgi:hypothetical protein
MLAKIMLRLFFLPAAVFLPPLVGLAGLVVILAVLVGVETSRYAQVLDSLRSA